MTLIEPPTLTPVEESLLTMQRLHRESLETLASKCREAFRLFWHNPNATRAEMAAGMGTNAAAAFEAHAATVTYLLSLDPSILAPADYTPPQGYTLNNNGSITLL